MCYLGKQILHYKYNKDKITKTNIINIYHAMTVQADCTFATSLYCLPDFSPAIGARRLQQKEYNYEFL